MAHESARYVKSSKGMYLNLWQMFRSPGQIHPPEANSNGAGRDEDHPVPILAELNCSLDNQGEY